MRESEGGWPPRSGERLCGGSVRPALLSWSATQEAGGEAFLPKEVADGPGAGGLAVQVLDGRPLWPELVSKQESRREWAEKVAGPMGGLCGL